MVYTPLFVFENGYFNKTHKHKQQLFYKLKTILYEETLLINHLVDGCWCSLRTEPDECQRNDC